MWVQSIAFASVCVVFAMTDGPAIISNHVLTDSSTVSSGDLSGGIMDLPAAGETQDNNAELSGSISNRTKTVKIHDIKIWFDGPNGPLKTSAGGAPVTGLKVGNAQSGSLKTAPLAGTSGGVATFNLPQGDSIGAGAAANYEAQVDNFAEPNNFKIKMAFSSQKAAKHFDIGGEGTFSGQINQMLFDGQAPTIRTGVVFGVVNADGVSSLKGATLEMISQDANVEFSGGEILDSNNQSVGTLVISTDGKMATVSGLNLANPDSVTVWLDLNASYQKTTLFKVTTRFQ